MVNKMTMINLVWMTMIGAMLATSIGFHVAEDKKTASMYGPSVTARYESMR